MSQIRQRARSPQDKELRKTALLEAARELAAEHGVREVTLTAVTARVGLHPSALRRYFESREELLLELAEHGWDDWRTNLVRGLGDRRGLAADELADIVSSSLERLPLFCDLLAQAPLNLERNVSLEAAYEFKTAVLGEVDAAAAKLRQVLGITERAALDVISTATSLAGALWQMAAPGTGIRALYETHPELAHAVVNVEPQLTRILTALLTGISIAPDRQIVH